MDIKKDRRDAVVTGKWTDRDLPMPEGQYPADNGSSAGSKSKGHGNATSDNNVGWDMRAQSWQRGADTSFDAIEREKVEQDKRFGTPHEDSFPAPSDPAGPKNCGARGQTASYNADETLPSPANFSSNPGFMGVSTGDMATSGNPSSGGTARIATSGAGRSLPWQSGPVGRTIEAGGGTTGGSSTMTKPNPTVGRSSRLGHGNVTMPAPGDTDPGSEGGPLVVSSGFSG